MAQTIVIVGASTNRKKYGNKAVRAFKDAGWTVYPVNPREKSIEGIPCYSSLKDIPKPVHRVSMYVPPATGMNLLDDIAALDPDEVFFNPGSADAALIARAREKGLNAIEACSIVSFNMSPEDYPDE